jgi:hypothetical protein
MRCATKKAFVSEALRSPMFNLDNWAIRGIGRGEQKTTAYTIALTYVHGDTAL